MLPANTPDGNTDAGENIDGGEDTDTGENTDAGEDASDGGLDEDDTDLLAGIAKVDITCPLGQPMGGYGHAGGCEDVHDPLLARVVVLKNGDISIAIVSVDLLFLCSDYVINQAKAQWDVDHVIISSTHTHAGPIPTTGGITTWSNLDVNPDEVLDFAAFSDDPWHAEVEAKVIAAIGEAINNLFPATISGGKGLLDSWYLAHNRRLVNEDGSVTMLWSNPSRMETSPVDHTVGVVRIDDSAGNPRAMMVNYACHAVTLGSSNRTISAGFPGAMAAYIENELGPESIALFIPGAAGDIDPYETGSTGDSAFNAIETAGTDLAQEALRVTTNAGNSGSLEVKESLMEFDDRWEADKTHQVGMTTIVIGDSIALVTLSGELFVQHQIDLRELSPLANTFLWGYSYNGQGAHYLIYVPTIQAAEEGGYGAGYTTFLEVGAGEQMISEAVDSINQFLE
jgi:hypothetical protein